MNFKSANSRDIGAGVLLVGVTLLAYLPAVNGGLIMDDAEHVTRAGLRSLHGLLRIWFEAGATAHYYPVLNTAFWMEYRLWGEAVAGYHLTTILLHTTSALLVVAIMRRLALPGAWLAAFIFALHPVCVESVAWISEQKNTLSAVFFLGSMLVYLGYDRDRRNAQYRLALGLFVLALFTKTVTATLPPALLVIFWWQRGRLEWKRDWLPLLPWWVLGATTGLFSAWFEKHLSGAQGAAFDLTWLERCLVAGRAICFYAGKLVWPVDLMYINPRWTINTAAVWQYLFPAGVVVVTAGLCLVARRHRWPLAAFLFFTGTLFPMLGFLNINWFNFSYVADHFQYLSSLGLIVPMAAGLTLAVRRIPANGRMLAPILAGLLLLPLGVLTWQQSGMYRNAEALYRETIARNPSCWLAHNNLGTILEETPGGLPQAIGHYEAAIRLKPDHARAHNNLGNALAKIPGQLPEAIANYEISLRLQSDVAEVHYNLANALVRIPDRLPAAIAEYQAAVRLKPDYLEAHLGLGNVLANIPGRLPEAVAAYQAVLRLDPDYAEAHNNLASVLADIPGRLPEAIAEYETALRLKPGYAEAYNNLAGALTRVPDRLPEAIAAFETALRLKPDYLEARFNLGNILTEIPGRLPEAIDQLEAAVRIAPDDPDARTSLAGALVRVPGRLPEAITHLEAVVRLRPNSARAHVNLGGALAKTPGHTGEARVHFEEALRIQPGFEPAREMLERLDAGR